MRAIVNAQVETITQGHASLAGRWFLTSSIKAVGKTCQLFLRHGNH